MYLYVRLPGGVRLLVDGGRRASPGVLEFLRRRGEVDPLHPLGRYLRPARRPNLAAWLQALALARGLVFRPGGAWIFWQPAPPAPPGGSVLPPRVVSPPKLSPPSYFSLYP